VDLGLVGLQLLGDAEILLALSNPAADLAEEFTPFHQVFVSFGELLNITDVLQIAEVILVIRMRHLIFFHFHSLSCSTVADFLKTDNVAEVVDYVAEFV
jgi:hypothetical protein